MVKKIGLKDAITHFQKFMNNVQLGKVLGVSADQVYKYSTGYTATCGDSVVDAFYDKLEIDGEKVLINYFESEEQYLMIRKARTEDET